MKRLLKEISAIKFVIRPVHRPMNKFASEILLKELSIVKSLFQDISSKVYLVGGVGMAIRQNKFYRNHTDFDVAVYQK